MKNTIGKSITAFMMCFAFTANAETVTPSDHQELKTMLTKAQGKVASHPEHARQLESKYDE